MCTFSTVPTILAFFSPVGAECFSRFAFCWQPILGQFGHCPPNLQPIGIFRNWNISKDTRRKGRTLPLILVTRGWSDGRKNGTLAITAFTEPLQFEYAVWMSCLVVRMLSKSLDKLRSLHRRLCKQAHCRQGLSHRISCAGLDTLKSYTLASYTT